jgi:hypothetical protein
MSHPRPRTAVLAVLAASALATATAAQTTYTVNPAQNIQAVINGAASGDVIELNPGTYQQIIQITGKNLTVRSTNPTDAATVAATVLDGVGLDSVIRIETTGAGTTVIEGLTVTGGSSAAGGGGIFIDSADAVEVRHCVIEGNECANPGGGIDCRTTSLTVVGSTFLDNHTLNAGSDGGAIYTAGSTVLVRGSHFEGNSSQDSGGAVRFDDSPTQVTDCTFHANTAAANGGGAIFIRSGTVLQVDASRFTQNVADYGGAATVWNDAGQATFRNCLFQGNGGNSLAGALYSDDQLTVHSSTFEGNWPEALNHGSSPVTTVLNSVLWNNGATPLPAGVTVQNSLVEGGYAAGTNILGGDPMFVDADGPDDDPLTFDDNDLALAAGSPAIDAGSTSSYRGAMTDLAGNPRGVDDPDSSSAVGESVIGPVVDMGAFEFQVTAVDTCPADLDGSGDVGFGDVLQIIGAWGACPE